MSVFCKDCLWYVQPNTEAISALCASPSRGLDLVSGEADTRIAKHARADTKSDCGVLGLWFVAAPPKPPKRRWWQL